MMSDGIVAGEFTVDLLVEEILLVELKAVSALNDDHRGQCLNYVKATGLRLCLLLNFGNPRLEIERIVFGLQSRLHLRALACIAYLIRG